MTDNSRIISEFSPKALESGYCNIFSDWRLSRKFGKITRITLHSGWVVDGFQVEYDNTFVTRFHGTVGGDKKVLDLAKDEYVTKIKVRTAEYKYAPVRVVSSLSFTTNKGQEFKGGSEQECYNIWEETVAVGPNEQIFAFSGIYGGYLSEISGVYKKPAGR